jgi:hypothetical protein
VETPNQNPSLTLAPPGTPSGSRRLLPDPVSLQVQRGVHLRTCRRACGASELDPR